MPGEATLAEGMPTGKHHWLATACATAAWVSLLLCSPTPATQEDMSDMGATCALTHMQALFQRWSVMLQRAFTLVLGG